MKEVQFNQLAAEGYNRIPVTLETFSDLDTPLSIYLKLANGPYTYLLESVQGGERFGRYSIIGLAAPTRIVVEDSGPGIAPQDRERVFAPFARVAQLDTVSGAPIAGTGLGLAIVSEVAQAHEGRVSIETSLLGGARMVVSFA